MKATNTKTTKGGVPNLNTSEGRAYAAKHSMIDTRPEPYTLATMHVRTNSAGNLVVTTTRGEEYELSDGPRGLVVSIAAPWAALTIEPISVQSVQLRRAIP